MDYKERLVSNYILNEYDDFKVQDYNVFKETTIREDEVFKNTEKLIFCS